MITVERLIEKLDKYKGNLCYSDSDFGSDGEDGIVIMNINRNMIGFINLPYSHKQEDE